MLTFEPLIPQNWPHLQALFGEKGACGGCWCMYWRLFHQQYEQQKGEKNKASLKELVQQGMFLGVLAMNNEVPVGWCSVSPKPSLVRLSKSRLFKNLEDTEAAWSITCLFVNKDFRNQGLSTQLINAASQYAFENGAALVEAYPILPQKKNVPPVFAYVGFESAFRKAGFEEVIQVSPTRSVMRLTNSGDD